LKTFHARIVKNEQKDTALPVPLVREVSEAEIDESFMRVKREIIELVENEMGRIMRDPVLKGAAWG